MAGEEIKCQNETKLLGVIITDNIKWDGVLETRRKLCQCDDLYKNNHECAMLFIGII